MKSGTRLRGGSKPQIRKAEPGGWTPAKQKAFLSELAATCNVTAALRAVNMTDSNVYRLRKRSAEFRAAWAEALREGYAKLELVLLERAIDGTVKTVVRDDGRTDTIREYPNNVALALLKMHKEGAAVADQQYDPAEIDLVRARIMKKLAIVRTRIEAGEE